MRSLTSPPDIPRIHLFLFILVLCFGNAGGTGEAVGGQILRFGLHTSGLGGIDPQEKQGTQDAVFADLVFNGLVRHAPGQMEIMEADLAREIPKFCLRGGRQVWRVSLRRGVFFHGSPGVPSHEMTSADVIFSLRRAIRLHPGMYPHEFQAIQFQALDDYTLEISLKRPLSPLFFFPLLSAGRGSAILSQRVIQAPGPFYPAGTGPFKFKEILPGGTCVLAAHGGYFRGRPRLDGVVLHFIPDNGERRAAFDRGDLDVIIGSAKAGWLENLPPGCWVDFFGPGHIGMFHFNAQHPPLDDPRVRRAIILALDRSRFLENTNGTLARPIFAPMPRNSFPAGWDEKRTRSLGLIPQQNLQGARRLLTWAGYPRGFDLSVYVSENRLYRQNYECLRDQLRAVGIELTLKVVSHTEMHRRIRLDQNPIVLYFSNRPNPDIHLRGFFHSHSIVGTGASPMTNFSHYTRVDHLLEDAFQQVDPVRQVQLWDQVQIRLLSDAVVYPIYNIKNCILRWDRVVYGHPLVETRLGYPQFTEATHLLTPLP